MKNNHDLAVLSGGVLKKRNKSSNGNTDSCGAGRVFDKVMRQMHSEGLLLTITLIAIVVALSYCSPLFTTTTYAQSVNNDYRDDDSTNGARKLKIVFMDLGVGQSSLVVLPNGKSMMIDGGEVGDAPEMLREIRQNGISKVDVIVPSHPHKDHFGGFIGVMQNIPVGEVLDSGQVDITSSVFTNFMTTIEEKKTPYKMVRQGDRILLDPDVEIEVLNPPPTLPEGYDNQTEFSNNSVVLKLTYGNFTILFPGDILKNTEERLVNEYQKSLDSDVLVAAHHGTGGANIPQFLSIVTPQVVIISPERSQPPNPAIDKFKAAEVQYIFRTEIDGDVTLISDGSQNYTLQASRASQIVTMPEFGKSDNASGVTAAALATMVAATTIVVVVGRERVNAHSNK